MEQRRVWFPGVPLALGAAILFGASTPFSKLLLGAVNPWLLAGILYLGAGIGLSLFFLIRAAFSPRPPEAPLQFRDLPWLTGVVAAGGIAGLVLLMFGLQATDASSASLLLNLEGVATMAIAWMVFRENVDGRLILGAAAILAGAAILSWSGEGLRLSWGSLLIAAACLAWGIDNNLSRKLGVCRSSCPLNLFHAASRWCSAMGRSGLSQTDPTGSQFRVLPDQRAGFLARAA
jgi:drug/metabolite transporter (DMT)-like permease